MNFLTPVLFVLLVWLGGSPSAYARPIGEYQNFKASVEDNFICASDVAIRIDSNGARDYADNRDGFTKIVALVRAAMAFECSEANVIVFRGFHGVEHLISATVSEATGWVLNVDAPKEGPSNTGTNQTARGTTQLPGRNSPSNKSQGMRTPVSNDGSVAYADVSTSEGITATVRTELNKYAFFWARKPRYEIETDALPKDANMVAFERLLGFEFEPARVYRLSGYRQTPVENPSTDIEKSFNTRLLNGDFKENGARRGREDALRISSVTPGGVFDKLGIEEGYYLVSAHLFNLSQNARNLNKSLSSTSGLQGVMRDIIFWRDVSNTSYPINLVIAKNAPRDKDLTVNLTISGVALTAFSDIYSAGDEKRLLFARQNKEIEKQMAPYYGVIKRIKYGDTVKRPTSEERVVMEQLNAEHYEIVYAAEDLSPQRCVSQTTSSFGFQSSDTTCINTVDDGLEVLRVKFREVPINRRKLESVCDTSLDSKFCRCLAGDLDGHFSQKQYDLFLQSPRGFAAHIADYRVYTSSNNIFVRGATNIARGRDFDAETVFIPSREIFSACRGSM